MKNVLIDFLSYARGSMAISKPGKWREEGKKREGKFCPFRPLCAVLLLCVYGLTTTFLFSFFRWQFRIWSGSFLWPLLDFTPHPDPCLQWPPIVFWIQARSWRWYFVIDWGNARHDRRLFGSATQTRTCWTQVYYFSFPLRGAIHC